MPSAPRSHRIWLALQAAVWLPWIGLALVSGAGRRSGWPALDVTLAAASFLALAATLRTWRTPADAATGVRFALLCGAVLLAASRGHIDLAVWGLFGAALALDGADGWLARRYGATEAGAILDMETDQLAFALVGLTGVGVGALPWPLLVPPLLRPLKLATGLLLGVDVHAPRPRGDDNRAAKTLCALASALVWLTLTPDAPALVAWVTSGAAAALLAWSFRVDFAEILAARRAA